MRCRDQPRGALSRILPPAQMSNGMRARPSSSWSSDFHLFPVFFNSEKFPFAVRRVGQDYFNRFTVIQDWLAENGVELPPQADVYRAEERYHSVFANRMEDFQEDTLSPLLERTEAAGYTLEEVGTFLHAQTAEESNIQVAKINPQYPDGGSGMLTAEANRILAATPQGLKDVANAFRKITGTTKQMYLRSGRVTQDTVLISLNHRRN